MRQGSPWVPAQGWMQLITKGQPATARQPTENAMLCDIPPSEHVSSQDYIGPESLPRTFLRLLRVRTPDLKLLANELDYISWTEDWVALPMMGWLSKVFGSKTSILSSNNLLVHLQAVRAGMGVALLPDYMGADDPTLCELALPDTISAGRRTRSAQWTSAA